MVSGLEVFAKFIGHGNAYLAELWSVLEGLKLARRLNFQAVELHIDSLTVVRNIMSNKSITHVGKSLVDRIRRFIELEWKVVVHHSYREANSCADALADHGCMMEHGILFFEKCPTNFSHLLLVNIMRISTPHLIHL
jgi:ribonuclease HI